MKNPYRTSFPTIVFPLLVTAVKIDLFARMLFMGRRKRTRYLARTLFAAVHPRPMMEPRPTATRWPLF